MFLRIEKKKKSLKNELTQSLEEKLKAVTISRYIPMKKSEHRELSSVTARLSSPMYGWEKDWPQ